jgi:flagellar assembly protein FliH
MPALSPQPGAAHEKFAFDTVFEATGEVISAAPRPKRTYSSEEVEAIRKTAEAAGEARALAGVANRQAEALAVIGRAAQQALPGLAAVAHEHRVGSAELALACARAIAAAALDKFPQAPVRAALEALAREIEAAPRLIVTGDAELADGLQAVLEETAQAVGYPGSIQVRAVPGQNPCAFTLDFGDGSASFDPTAAAERVSEALHAALAAEGLHAEPLIPGGSPALEDSES